MTTDFRFQIDTEEWDSGGRALGTGSMWAPNAKQALRDFIKRQAGIRGFLGIDSIDPMPTHVRLEEDDSLDAMGEFDRLNALLVLAEQSGCTTPAEARFYLHSLRDPDEAKALGKLILAEWQAEHTGHELMGALANQIAAE